KAKLCIGQRVRTKPRQGRLHNAGMAPTASARTAAGRAPITVAWRDGFSAEPNGNQWPFDRSSAVVRLRQRAEVPASVKWLVQGWRPLLNETKTWQYTCKRNR